MWRPVTLEGTYDENGAKFTGTSFYFKSSINAERAITKWVDWGRGNEFLENMLNLGSKTSPRSQIFTIPSNFRNHVETPRQGHFLDLHVTDFVKNDRITVSVPIILSINQRSLYHFKKKSGRLSDIHITIKCVFIFLQIIIRSQKNWCETQ